MAASESFCPGPQPSCSPPGESAADGGAAVVDSGADGEAVATGADELVEGDAVSPPVGAGVQAAANRTVAKIIVRVLAGEPLGRGLLGASG